MELVLKNTTLKFAYHPLTWVTQTFDENDRISRYIYSSLLWQSDGFCYLIPRTSAMKQLRVAADTSKNCGLAFLTSNRTTPGTSPDFCKGTTRLSVVAGTIETFTIPDDCTYIYILSGVKASAPAEHLPKSVQIGELL